MPINGSFISQICITWLLICIHYGLTLGSIFLLLVSVYEIEITSNCNRLSAIYLLYYLSLFIVINIPFRSSFQQIEKISLHFALTLYLLAKFIHLKHIQIRSCEKMENLKRFHPVSNIIITALKLKRKKR